MATITSTQSGPFDVGSTWVGGVAPVNGDSFIVAQGHVVAVTGDIRPTNGFDNSTVQGKLHIQGSGCMLRMNGNLTIDSVNSNTYFTEGVSSAPYFRMDPGSILEIRGTNADAHRLWVNPEQRITVEILGTNPNPQTTISSDISPSGSPGPISFTDASDFAPGDWITVYMPERTGKSWIYNRSDESFWVHDVDGNNVYFRQFVGPESTIVAASVNKIVVNDAKVFRKGYHLIFGSGSNRNVRTITDISYGTNTITLNNNISGSVIGEKVYQTGSDKHHISGDKVLRLAAVTTQDAAVGANSIVVNNTNGFNVGDRILIQPNSEDYNEVSYGNFIADYTITNINTSTNVITFTNGYVSSAQTTLQKKTNAGALVVNINRDTKITAPEGTTYGSDQRSFIYFQGGDVYYRRFKIKNVLINIGSYSDANNYACIGMRGASSYELTSYGQYTSEFEGNVIYPVFRSSRNTGYMWEQHQRNFRNNISYNAGSEGFYFYGNNVGLFGNIFMCNASWGTNCGSFMSNDQHAYNYYASCGGGFYVAQWAWSGNKAIHHNIVINTGTATYCDYIYCSGFIYRCYFNRYLHGPHANSARRSKIYTLDCYLGNAWDVTNPNGNGTYTTYWQGAVDGSQATNTIFDDINTTYSICDNFKYDGFREEKRDVIRLWDSNERSWKVYPDFDYSSTSYYCGFGNTFFLPAGAKAFITGTIKLIYSAATNYPYLWVGKVGDLYYGGQYNGYDGITDAVLSPASSMINKYIGFRSLVRFTSACKTNYESITTTIGPYTDDMFIKTSVVSLSNTTGEIRRGWYERDMRISMDNPSPMTAPLDAFSTLSTRIPITYKKTADETRIVWGGRGG